MRHLMFSVLTVSCLSLLAGCCNTGCSGYSPGHSSGCSGGSGSGHSGAGSGWLSGSCSHGVCDCEIDDHCSTRTPWVKFAPAQLGMPVEAVPVAPRELPKGDKL